MQKIKEMNKKDKLRLACLAALFVIVMASAAAAFFSEDVDYNIEEIRKSIYDTAWQRDTQEGKEIVIFTRFGDFFIGTFKESEVFTKDSAWLSYEIGKKEEITIEDATNILNLPIIGEHEFKAYFKVADSYIRIDDAVYEAADFDKWINRAYSDEYWQ